MTAQRNSRRTYYARNRDRPAHLATRFCLRAKVSAKQRGLPFDLRPADIAVPARCPVLGVVLTVGVGRFGPASPTLVLLEPALGFVRGNVRVISKQASYERAPQTRTAAADGLRPTSRQPQT
jgi:hypothetical protein